MFFKLEFGLSRKISSKLMNKIVKLSLVDNKIMVDNFRTVLSFTFLSLTTSFLIRNNTI